WQALLSDLRRFCGVGAGFEGFLAISPGRSKTNLLYNSLGIDESCKDLSVSMLGS
ncbi:hypothetical protein N311_09116, partial [Apaloderma vittatum]